VNAKHERDFVDAINVGLDRDFDTFDQASEWLLGTEGQAALARWAEEGDGFIEIPFAAARPFDQVFGDTSGVDREALPVHQAAQVADAVADLDFNPEN
jgi:hypothetical protein